MAHLTQILSKRQESLCLCVLGVFVADQVMRGQPTSRVNAPTGVLNNFLAVCITDNWA